MMFRLRYQIVQIIWDIGTALREWACVAAGGSHDYVDDVYECIVCGHPRR